ncbi:MAG: histidine kinase dimerization/phosphoacceptor domain -containing protein [Desulfosarcinaceae bacterium]
MQLNRLTLNFKGENLSLEVPFRQAYLRQNLSHMRLWHLLSMLAFGSAGFFDAALFPEQWPILWVLRYVCVMPLFVVSLLLTWTQAYRRVWQGLNMVHILSTGIAGIIAMLLTLPPFNVLYLFSLILSMLFGYAFVRERFLYASICGTLLLSGYFVANKFWGLDSGLGAWSADIYIVIVFNLLGMSIAYSMEYAARKDFFLSWMLSRQNEKLMTSLKEKDLLLKEVHHRVKNNLQVVASLLDMTRYRSREPIVSAALLGARSKIQAMALIHTQLYRKQSVDFIDMHQQIQDLYQNLRILYPVGTRIHFHLDADDIHLSVTQALPCALIVNELLSNALKHAFTEHCAGNIYISFKQPQEGKLHLSVSDDGCGLPEGMAVEQVSSLGLKLVRVLVIEQLEGTMRLESNPGAAFHIYFRASPVAAAA